ncbi:MAG: hypothetical protein DRP08_05430 [Candidatus Aenigmatarchaeota archaeon]|nr:MAG: hypothetical protein DRP08_05430 [Candidatus Aenigmarchaeota archaeon]
MMDNGAFNDFCREQRRKIVDWPLWSTGKGVIMTLKLDLGCGRFKKEGFVGLDIEKYKGVDKIIDLRKGLPYKDNSVDEIYTNHFLEHLEIEDVVRVIKEIHRVCKPGAKVMIRVPHFSGRWAFYEFHKTFFRHDSFRDFIEGNDDCMTNVKFRLVSRKIRFPRKRYPWNVMVQKIANACPEFYEDTFMKSLFPAFDLEFVFSVVKEK